MRVLRSLTGFLITAHAAHAAAQPQLATKDVMDLTAQLNQVVSDHQADDSLKRNLVGHADALNAIAETAKNGSPIDRATAVCNIAQAIFDRQVVTAEEANYTQLEQVNWSQMCWLPARCFLRPRNACETAIALKLVTLLRSKFAVRSGGHNPGQGFASIGSEGALIDMGAINQVTLSQDKSFVSLGPGARWEQVYGELEKHQLTVVGGRVAGVGVGGLILGGGMSHFSNHWGMVVDNIKNYEIVLADSRVVNVNKYENPDLFAALKGGGPNFGIITRYDLYTKPDYKMWYTIKAYSANDSDRVMAAAVQVEKSMETDDKVGFFLTTTPTSLAAGMLYRDWVDARPEAFSPFDDITPLAVATPETNGTQKSFAEVSAQNEIGKRASGTAAVEPDAELYVKTLRILQNITSATPNISLVHTFQPLGAPSVAKSQSLGGNLLNVKPVSQSWLAIAAYWTDDADNEKAVEQTQTLIKQIKAAAADAGKLLDFDFMNDANFAQSPLKHYGEASLAVMRKAAAKYDPSGVFQTLQNNGFLLSKVDQSTVP